MVQEDPYKDSSQGFVYPALKGTAACTGAEPGEGLHRRTPGGWLGHSQFGLKWSHESVLQWTGHLHEES